MGFAEILFLIFLVLKLTSVIDWSWWWVTAPLWVSLLITIPIMVGGMIAGRRASKSFDRKWNSFNR